MIATEGAPIRKLGVALQGGAFNFPFEVGVIKECEDRGIVPDYIVGVSAGALAGAFWAMNKTKELYALKDRLSVEGSKMIYTSQFMEEKSGHFGIKMDGILKYLDIKLNLGTAVKVLFGGKDKILKTAAVKLEKLPGFADNTPLFKLLQEYVFLKDFPEGRYKCGFVCHDTSDYVVVGPEDFDNEDEWRKAIWASASMPGIWPAIASIRLKDGTTYYNCTDGGVRNNSPIMDVKHFVDQDETPNHLWGILAINCNNEYMKPRSGPINAFGAIGRAGTTLLDEGSKNDLSAFTVVNDILEAVGHPVTINKTELDHIKVKTYRHYNFGKIEPVQDELGNSMDTSPAMIHKRFELGRQRAREYFESLNA